MATKMPCKAIVFDFDGTLADSMPFLEEIGVATMMKYFGVTREDATQRYRSTTGLPYEHQVKLNFPDNTKNEAAIEEFEALKIANIFDQDLMPGSVAAVEHLAASGIEVFVSSSTFQPTIEKYFERRGLSHLFTDIIGYRPGFEKGADHFKYISEEHGIDFKDMIFVGDSLKDHKRSEGFCRFIALTGMFSEEDFRNEGHIGPVVQSLSEIPDYVEPS
jgi:phosphoglycolate phosphatase-like HAD superfamily hydrolase